MQIQFRSDKEFHKKVKELAKGSNRSVSDLCRLIIDREFYLMDRKCSEKLRFIHELELTLKAYPKYDFNECIDIARMSFTQIDQTIIMNPRKMLWEFDFEDKK